jgi:hypothetical protein
MLSPPPSGTDNQSTIRNSRREGIKTRGLFPDLAGMNRPGLDDPFIQRTRANNAEPGKAHVFQGPADSPHVSRFHWPGEDDHHFRKDHADIHLYALMLIILSMLFITMLIKSETEKKHQARYQSAHL